MNLGFLVLTYALMSNHFHLLCEVPQAREVSEAELLDRIQAGYGPARRQALRDYLLERNQPAVSQVPLCARKLEHHNQAASL